MSVEDESDRVAPRRRLGLGAAVVLVIVALAVTVAIGILRGASAPVERVSIDDARTDAATPVALYVHVSGSVVEPGLYVLEGGARVVDAIAAAGGFADGADDAAVNLARPVSDGEQLDVPEVGEAPAADSAAGAGGGPDALVDLNTADVAALETLPRIGPALAQRIIDWRDANGRFTAVEDLLAVPGIGDKMLESLRDLVAV